jgi:hypothetical protein
MFCVLQHMMFVCAHVFRFRILFLYTAPSPGRVFLIRPRFYIHHADVPLLPSTKTWSAVACFASLHVSDADDFSWLWRGVQSPSACLPHFHPNTAPHGSGRYPLDVYTTDSN